jgi:hypothetical protein
MLNATDARILYDAVKEYQHTLLLDHSTTQAALVKCTHALIAAEAVLHDAMKHNP